MRVELYVTNETIHEFTHEFVNQVFIENIADEYYTDKYPNNYRHCMTMIQMKLTINSGSNLTQSTCDANKHISGLHRSPRVDEWYGNVILHTIF